MRESTLLLLLALAACGEGAREDYVVIEDFVDRSPRLECEAVAEPGDLAVTELRAASDSTVLVLDEPGRRLVELDAGLSRVWELELPAAGPGAVGAPVSMALLGDTAVAVAERQGLQLIVFSRAGELIRATPLGFAPSAVAVRPSGELLVTALPFGDLPDRLLHRFNGGGFEPLPVMPRPYGDMFVGALGNATLAEALPDGGVLMVHQFIAPRAFRIDPDGRVDRLRMPTPDGTVAAIGWMPTGPLLDDQIERIMVAASALSVDRTRSEVYVLARSGRRLTGGAERAVLRLDAGLQLIDSYTLDMMARHLAVLSRSGTVLIVDDEDRFHACTPNRLDRYADAE